MKNPCRLFMKHEGMKNPCRLFMKHEGIRLNF